MYSSSSHEIVLTSSPDGPITAYDTVSGTSLASFTGSRSPRHGLVLVGTYIAASHISSATASGSIHLYNWWSPKPLHQLSVPEPVAPLASSPDGFFLFAGGLSGNIFAFSVPSGNILKSFLAHNKPVSCLTISSDSSLLISGGDDGLIVVMPIFQLLEASENDNPTPNLILNKFVAHNAPVTAITSCYRLSLPTIFSCSSDCTCTLWSVLEGIKLQIVTFPCVISGVALDPTGKEFYGAGSDGLIYKGLLMAESRKEASKGQELSTWSEKHGASVVSVAVVNEGKNLVSAGEDGSVYVWEIERGEVIMIIGNGNEVGGIAVGKGIVGASYGYCRDGSWRLSRPMKDAVDMEGLLSEKRKSMELLESAVGVYQRLLELILKEASNAQVNNT